MLLRNLTGISLIAITIAVQVFSAQATFYVSPTGSDNNAGTLAAPFATIAKAQNAVRAVNTAMTDDIVVYLRGGWYTLSSTLTFAPADGGTNGHNVIYQAYTGEYPVISGGKQVTGWSIHDAAKNIWKATAPQGMTNRQLYVNCVRATRAHKMTAPWRMNGPTSGGGFNGSASINTTGYTIGSSDAGMASWGNQSDIEFAYPQCASNWTERRCCVQSISGTTITMKQPGWGYCINGRDGQKITVAPKDIENAYELLNLAGEWYLDKTANIVYYIPRTNESLATARVITPVVDSILVSIAGTLDNPVKNIQFKGITFAHGTFLRPNSEGWSEWQCGVMTNLVRTPGNITVGPARNIRFERCMFKHLGAAGLDINNGAKKTTVIGCVFTDISGNCIQIGNHSDRGGADVRAQTDSTQIVNCYVHDSPIEFRGGNGITGYYTSNLLLSYNEIFNNPYSAISVGWGWSTTVGYSKNNVFTYNRIHDYMQAVWDGGGIYTLGAQTNSTYHHNYVYNWYSYAYYLDQGTDYFNVHDNVVNNIIRPNGGGGNWCLFNYIGNNCSFTNNYTDQTSFFNITGYFPGANNPIISNGQWPQAATDIMNGAGLQSAYTDIRTMPCGCSVSAQAGTIGIGSLNQQKQKMASLINGKAFIVPGATEKIDLSIMDATGRLVYVRNDLSLVNKMVNVDNGPAIMPAGVFFLKILCKDGNGRAIAKMTLKDMVVGNK